VGAAAAFVTLVALVGILGTALVVFIPLNVLRIVVGVLLVLFGLKWLKKAILRYAGLKALHDEEAIYEQELAELRARGEHPTTPVEPFGVVTSFKSVLLEGLEVAFIVITFGAQVTDRTQLNGILVAALGAAGALVLVLAIGGVAQAPLRQVPENTL